MELYVDIYQITLDYTTIVGTWSNNLPVKLVLNNHRLWNAGGNGWTSSENALLPCFEYVSFMQHADFKKRVIILWVTEGSNEDDQNAFCRCILFILYSFLVEAPLNACNYQLCG